MFSSPISHFSHLSVPLPVTCDAKDQTTDIEISWLLSESKCWDSEAPERSNATVRSKKITSPCKHDGHIILDELKSRDSLPDPPAQIEGMKLKQSTESPVYTVVKDGIYIFQLTITQPQQKPFWATVHIEIRAPYGYLSAIDWPLLLVRKRKTLTLFPPPVIHRMRVPLKQNYFSSSSTELCA